MKARKAGVAMGGCDWADAAEAALEGWELEMGRTGGDGEAILLVRFVVERNAR